MRNATASATRREAIRRAAEHVVILAVDPTATTTAHQHAATVNNLTLTDQHAWEAVAQLDDMVTSRNLLTPEQWRARAEQHRPQAEADLTRWVN